MLSARAEFRLSLRPDNADLRLSEAGVQLGLVGAERAASFAQRRQQVEEAESLLDSVRLSSSAWGRQGLQVAQDGGWISAAQMLTRPGTTLQQLATAAAVERPPGWQQLQELAERGSSSSSSGTGSGVSSEPIAASTFSSGNSTSGSAVDTAVFNCHYRPYLAKMEAEVAELRRDEALRIPPGLDYSTLQLSAEDREKLAAAQPASLAAAQRIPGVTPSALMLLLQHVRKRQPRDRSNSGGSSEGGKLSSSSSSASALAQEAAAAAAVSGT
jgi:tRNA uridine 5-carboxymethylaminomethyl modification enzyme